MFEGLGAISPLQAGYIGIFVLAAVGCFLCLPKSRRIADQDTRVGLQWLLLTSGGWALAHVGYLAASEPWLQEGFYLFGLIVGIAAVGPWLYFCSAYSGRTLHRVPSLRIGAVLVFLGIVSIKLTNPFHALYYSTTVGSEPFVHLAITHGTIHWLTMGFAYILAAIGFFMLIELFARVGQATGALTVVVGLAGLPVVFDVYGAVSPTLLDLTYSPLGVAAFAIGVTWVYFERFESVQLAGESGNPIIVLDDEDEIREANRSAMTLFPDLKDSIGQPLTDTVPELESHLDADTSILTLHRSGATRYFRLTVNPFSSDHAHVGREVTLTDVTEREQYRQQLERQNKRLEEFASIISHDLRNPLTVASGRVALAREEADSEHLDAVEEAHDRMEALIEDVLALARQGQPIDEMERVAMDELVRNCWEFVETRDASLEVSEPFTIQADPERLRQLLENLFRNAIEHGGTDVTITVEPTVTGFAIEDNGPGVPPDDRESVFEWGVSTDTDGTGFGLAIVEEIAGGHGWSVQLTDGSDGGARFEFSGVDLGES